MDARLLVVGGASCIAMTWIEELEASGAKVEVVTDGTAALRHLDLLDPDVVLVDVHLPGALDGFDTCRAIRSRSNTLVVFATSRRAPFDEVVALAVGGDHFFESDTPIPIVVARLRSLLRRSRAVARSDAALVDALGRSAEDGAEADRAGRHLGVHAGGAGASEQVNAGDLAVDLAAREVRVNGELIRLTRIEFDLLATLARSPRRVFTREQLMASAWGQSFDGGHVLDSHLSRLRRKIDRAGGQRVAHSVRGVGYRLRS